MNPYPVNLSLSGRPALLVGGGRVACRKLEELHRAGADITVVGPELHPDTEARVAEWGIVVRRRPFRTEDAEGCFLLIAAATGEVNREAAAAARRSGAIVNVVDNPELSDFTMPAIVRRGRLLLTASTGGALPAFSRRLRESLEHSFGEEYASYLDFVAELRPIVMRTLRDAQQRRRIFFRLADFDMVALHAEDPAAFRRVLADRLPPQVFAELERGLPHLARTRRLAAPEEKGAGK